MGYLKVYSLNGDVNFSGLKDIMQLETLLEIPSFLDESNRVYYEYKNGKECGFIFNASAEIEIPKKYFEDSSGRVALLLIRVYLTESGEIQGEDFIGSGIAINYKVKDGVIYFSKG